MATIIKLTAVITHYTDLSCTELIETKDRFSGCGPTKAKAMVNARKVLNRYTEAPLIKKVEIIETKMLDK